MASELVEELRSGDAMAAARALRELAQEDAAPLNPWRKDLLELAMSVERLEVRWNLILVVGKLQWTPSQRAVALDWLFERLVDESPFSRTFALQALFDLSVGDEALRGRVLPIAREFAESGTAAMRARARKLLGIRRIKQ